LTKQRLAGTKRGKTEVQLQSHPARCLAGTKKTAGNWMTSLH
jgi:hypothetical protein